MLPWRSANFSRDVPIACGMRKSVIEDRPKTEGSAMRRRLGGPLQKLEALDFGLAGLAQEHDVVIVGRLPAILLPCIDNSGIGVFSPLQQT